MKQDFRAFEVLLSSRQLKLNTKIVKFVREGGKIQQQMVQLAGVTNTDGDLLVKYLGHRSG